MMEALELLGTLLEERRLTYEVLAIGGGALVLMGALTRATADLDIVARKTGRWWRRVLALASQLVEAVEDVAESLDLDACKPWLNDDATFIFGRGLLPVCWESRSAMLRFGGFCVVLPG